MISWRTVPTSRPCDITFGDKCQRCSTGYYLDLESSKCYRITPHCGEYEKSNKEVCKRC